jgi:GTP:adenosylcobinamide-phosphate guanylyltransferase
MQFYIDLKADIANSSRPCGIDWLIDECSMYQVSSILPIFIMRTSLLTLNYVVKFYAGINALIATRKMRHN